MLSLKKQAAVLPDTCEMKEYLRMHICTASVNSSTDEAMSVMFT